MSSGFPQHKNNENDTAAAKIAAPDCMNQSIFEMVKSQPSSTALSRQISGLYSPQVALQQPSNENSINTGIPRNFKYFMPYPLPWRATAGPDQPPADFQWVTESCGIKAAIGVFGGAGMGLLMGVFLGAMSDMTPPVTVLNGKDVPQAPLREQMRTTLRATAEKSLYWSRNFAFITGVFGGSDCLVEKYRGTHDVWNSVISGCITGAAMQAKQGPQAAAMGCGGFAVFSLVIDKVMGTH
eukprot:CAMPEP_0197826366 /NCGR_PEP_ID=MMETSP1437-20131217/3335_1 /TAXON_ID=49252 ORGANISM="Eucampia antarctica, Strain CCMP1452" /NCGR_SAMPLE_ID=MMETSP1437 /ASSEMBLY_ACC=CAM_ASM_001096 /LENGTH=238 /DNA_ID=CAMNT_0043426775 /DNA_START=67 /DNA_END=783 /DNA_ORIENTATION=+